MIFSPGEKRLAFEITLRQTDFYLLFNSSLLFLIKTVNSMVKDIFYE